MKNLIKTIGLIMLLMIGQISYGQTNKEKANEKGEEAIKLMDNGKLDESIKLLKEAQELDPEKISYTYEIALAHYLKENYKTAIKTLETIINNKDANERFFQLLGNSYDIIGKTEKAFEVYDNGLKLFPNSGILNLEKGNVYWNKKKYGEALPFYEKGIEVDPQFPSNYYRATLIYCASTEEVWGMIYGEIFMNLERNSKRTIEISKLLYDTYKKEIQFSSDTSFSVSFSQNASININDLKDPSKLRLPFGVGVYEPTLMFSMLSTKSIDINSLNDIRNNFVDNYYKNNHDKNYPIVLFDYQKKIKDAGHFEAYNYWILMKGDEDGFDKWHKSNKEKWDAFVKWFTENELIINDSNKFYSGQY